MQRAGQALWSQAKLLRLLPGLEVSRNDPPLVEKASYQLAALGTSKHLWHPFCFK
jgi:hypothetical protein